MALSYLNGGESVTAARMNELFEAFDDKLKKLWSNKSFILDGRLSLLGNVFVFAGGVSNYAWQLVGDQNIKGNRPVLAGSNPYQVASYNHQQFVEAADAVSILSTDAEKRIARCTDPAMNWSGSLEAHYRNMDGAKYYLWPESDEFPQRHQRLAQADIVIDGSPPITFLFDTRWDKYNAFRVHNLTRRPVTVICESLTFELLPFACRCFRRTAVGGEYTLGYTYFQKFLTNDPRFYIQTIDQIVAISTNNVANPAILLDIYQNVLTQGTSAIAYADESVVCDLGDDYEGLFGDISNPATKLGDLLHHQGRLLVALSTGTSTEFRWVTFTGYDNIQADFFGSGVDVTMGGNGQWQLEATDSGVITDIISVSSNLLKRGEAIPSIVNVNTAYELERVNPYTNSAGVLNRLPTAATRTTAAWPSTRYGAALSVPYETLALDGVVASREFNPAADTVFTLLGEATQSDLHDARLVMTPAGLQLSGSYAQALDGIPTATVDFSDATINQFGKVRFVEQGWPLMTGAGSLFNSPRVARYYSELSSFRRTEFQDEQSGADGADFRVVPVLAVQEDQIKRLERITLFETSDYGQQFVALSNPDVLRDIINNYRTTGWYLAARPRLLAGTITDGGSLRMPLLREHWNLMAMAVNQITSCRPMSYRSIRLTVPSPGGFESITLTPNEVGYSGTSIRPKNQFCRLLSYVVNGVLPQLDPNRRMASLLGIPRKSTDDSGFPTEDDGLLAYEYKGLSTQTDYDQRPLNSQWIPVDTIIRYEWLAIEDVQSVIESLGFSFSYEAVVVPLKVNADGFWPFAQTDDECMFVQNTFGPYTSGYTVQTTIEGWPIVRDLAEIPAYSFQITGEAASEDFRRMWFGTRCAAAVVKAHSSELTSNLKANLVAAPYFEFTATSGVTSIGVSASAIETDSQQVQVIGNTDTAHLAWALVYSGLSDVRLDL